MPAPQMIDLDYFFDVNKPLRKKTVGTSTMLFLPERLIIEIAFPDDDALLLAPFGLGSKFDIGKSEDAKKQLSLSLLNSPFLEFFENLDKAARRRAMNEPAIMSYSSCLKTSGDYGSTLNCKVKPNDVHIYKVDPRGDNLPLLKGKSSDLVAGIQIMAVIEIYGYWLMPTDNKAGLNLALTNITIVKNKKARVITEGPPSCFTDALFARGCAKVEPSIFASTPLSPALSPAFEVEECSDTEIDERQESQVIVARCTSPTPENQYKALVATPWGMRVNRPQPVNTVPDSQDPHDVTMIPAAGTPSAPPRLKRQFADVYETPKPLKRRARSHVITDSQ